MNIVTELTIDRTKWLRGEGSIGSYLLRPMDSKMCCVGFYCLQGGFSPEQLEYKRWPYPDQIADLPSDMKWLIEGDTLETAQASDPDSRMLLSEANDHQAISEEKRERIITAIFARNGVTVTFIN